MNLPVAARWFDVTQVDEDLTLITEPHTDPWVRANAWHIRGADRDVLVDAGLGVASLRDFVLGEVADREPVVVLTHAHLDHMGSAHEFAEVWAHPAEPVALPGRGSLIGSEFIEILGLGEFPDDPVPDLLIHALPYDGYDPASYTLMPTTVTRPLHDGDTVDLGNRTLHVLHLPGHTPGSLALHDPQTRALYSGDVVYDEVLLDAVRGSNIADYVRSMRRLREVGVDVVHPGHYRSFDRDRLLELIDAYLAWRAPEQQGD